LLIENKKHSNTSHRGHLDIMADILEAAHGETRKTYLMYRCNLSFKQLKYYLDFLFRKELLRIVNKNCNPNLSLFEITEKGKNFLKVYKSLKALMK